MEDFGVNIGKKIKTDASAAKGVATRKGFGKVRHIHAKQLSVQECVSRGDMVIDKINGKEGIADKLTKPLNVHLSTEFVRQDRHVHALGE